MTQDLDNPKLNAALSYARLGMAVLPLHTLRGSRHERHCSCGRANCGDAGKHPLTAHGVSDATTDETKIRRWWRDHPDANLGIATGKVSGIIVVDVDPRHQGDETWRKLLQEHGDIAPTPHGLTGGGGDHYVMRYPEGREVSSGKLAQGVDLQSDGRYVVAPPSTHRTGFEYAWDVAEHIEDVPIAEPPGWLLSLAAQRSTPATADTLAEEWEHDLPPARLPDWAMRLWTGEVVVDAADGEERPRAQVADVDRSETLWRIGKALGSAGVDGPQIAAALANRDVALGFEKYSGRRNGYAAREYNRIAAKAVSEYEPPDAPVVKLGKGTTEPEPAQEAVHRWQPIPASELDPNGERVDWIWEGYLARGAVTELVGLWKAGKTTLLAHLIRVMQSGGTFAGMVVTKSRVLVITEEHSSLWIERRDEYGLSDHVHFICRPFLGKPNLNVWREFTKYCGALVATNEYDAVILDPFATLTPVEDENDAAEMTTCIVEFHRITEAGAGLLVPHHPNKVQSGQGMSSRGSGALPGFVDVILEFSRYDPGRMDDRRRVLRGLSRFRETPQEVVIELTDDGYVVAGTKAEARHSDRAEIILGLLSRLPVTADAIRRSWPEGAAVAQPSWRTILRDLETLTAEGAIVQTGSGTKGDPRTWTLK